MCFLRIVSCSCLSFLLFNRVDRMKSQDIVTYNFFFPNFPRKILLIRAKAEAKRRKTKTEKHIITQFSKFENYRFFYRSEIDFFLILHVEFSAGRCTMYALCAYSSAVTIAHYYTWRRAFPFQHLGTSRSDFRVFPGLTLRRVNTPVFRIEFPRRDCDDASAIATLLDREQRNARQVGVK